MNTPKSRDYTHQTCQADTTVSGGEFKTLSDPLASMKQTVCGQCEEVFPVEEFVWSDTGETLPDYYARHGRKAAESDRMLCSNQGLLALGGAGLFIGLMIGTAICLTMGTLAGIFIAAFMALVGAVAGIIVRETVVTPKIQQRVCGVSDTRQLK